jgi:hypothetical protein
MTVYRTERDKAQHRKTLAWLYVVNNPAARGLAELEIRFRREAGTWSLHDIVEAWSG